MLKIPHSEAIKQRMQKDVDEVQKIARAIKSKIEELDKDVWLLLLCSTLWTSVVFEVDH